MTDRPATGVISDADRTFTAMTFNVYYGTEPARLEKPFRRGLELSASLLYVQEAGNRGVRQLLRSMGLRTAFHPAQYLLAWDPAVWRSTDRYGIAMSRSVYFTVSGNPARTNAVVVELVHKPSHLTLQAMSYHTPAAVQRPPHEQPSNRIKVLRDSAETWGRMATKARADGFDAVLYGGDDNVDEHQGTGSDNGQWEFMLRGATGLTQVQAPEGTEHNRRIDDFRQYGLRRLGDGTVYDTVSDHNAYVQPFRFRRLRTAADR